MDLDSKEQVLAAIYKESQKGSPNMESVTYVSLGIPEEIFLNILVTLDSEGFVKYLRFPGAGAGSVHPVTVAMRDARISKSGIEYVESTVLVNETAIAKEDI